MIQNCKNILKKGLVLLSAIILVVSINSCEQFELPEAGSIEDLTPPVANFSASVGDDYLTYKFDNLSISATDYVWDFGDGKTSTEVAGANVYQGEGTYTVKLTASDKLGASSTFSVVVEVVKPITPPAIVPLILNPSFDDPGDDGKYTAPWVDDNLGKTIQISSSSSFVGGKSSKFPDANGDPRIAYQKDIAVTPNTDYILTYYYSIETGDPSTVTVAVLGGTVTSPAAVAGATIKKFVGTTQVGKTPFEKVDLAFNSGNNSAISIHISNTGPKTSYVEEFSAIVAE